MSLLRYDLPRTVLAQPSKLRYISHSRDEGEWYSQPHTHDCAELFYVLHGSGELLVDAQRQPMRAGELWLVNPHIPHTERSSPGDALEYLVVGLDGVRFEDPERSEERCFLLQDAGEQYRFYLEAMLRECEGQQEGWSELCGHLGQALLLLLQRRFSMQAALPLRSKGGSECARVQQYIDAHYAEPLNLDKLATLTHMSKHYLVHSFSREVGMSPIRYLNHRRIEESKRLLEHADSPVGLIGMSVGFSGLSYYTQRFKEATGQTPTAYRRAYLRRTQNAGTALSADGDAAEGAQSVQRTAEEGSDVEK